MATPELLILCPTCHRPIHVTEDWRLAQCPQCGSVVPRMADDSAYD